MSVKTPASCSAQALSTEPGFPSGPAALHTFTLLRVAQTSALGEKVREAVHQEGDPFVSLVKAGIEEVEFIREGGRVGWVAQYWGGLSLRWSVCLAKCAGGPSCSLILCLYVCFSLGDFPSSGFQALSWRQELSDCGKLLFVSVLSLCPHTC